MGEIGSIARLFLALLRLGEAARVGDCRYIRGQVFDFSKLAGIELNSRMRLLPANSEKPNT
jgi:hypothetical protein